MEKVRRLLWKQFGITLDHETQIVGAAIGIGLVGLIGFGIAFAITHSTLFLLLAIVSAAAPSMLAFGGSYDAISWSLSSKEQRKKIEEEIALKQLRRRARDKHYEP